MAVDVTVVFLCRYNYVAVLAGDLSLDRTFGLVAAASGTEYGDDAIFNGSAKIRKKALEAIRGMGKVNEDVEVLAEINTVHAPFDKV